MDKRYTQFNEVTFEAYIKAAVDKSVLKARLKKAARCEQEQTFSMLSEAFLSTLAADETENERAEMDCHTFNVRGIKIPVYGKKLADAISYLLPRDREIILLYFFLGLTDKKISEVIGCSRTTIQRRRADALEKLEKSLEDMK